MSAIQTPSTKVLVTGASGFVAVHFAKALLEAGHSVRGTVRSPSKGEYLKTLFEGLGFVGKFEYVIVKDIVEEGAFDEAVKGVDAVQHVASPVTMKFNEPEDIIDPAVKGTVGILESIRNHGHSVRKVLIISSFVAIMSGKPGPYTETENDWNDPAVQEVESLGKKASGFAVYSASKVLAERAAWDHLKKHRDEVNYDLVVVNPPWIFGPVLQEAQSYQQLNESTLYALNGWKAAQNDEQFAAKAGEAVDARDLSRLSAELLFAEKARNQRIIVSGGGFSVQDLVDNLSVLPNIASGYPGAARGQGWDVSSSTERLESILGKPSKELFRPFATTIKDTVKSVLDRGLIV